MVNTDEYIVCQFLYTLNAILSVDWVVRTVVRLTLKDCIQQERRTTRHISQITSFIPSSISRSNRHDVYNEIITAPRAHLRAYWVASRWRRGVWSARRSQLRAGPAVPSTVARRHHQSRHYPRTCMLLSLLSSSSSSSSYNGRRNVIRRRRISLLCTQPGACKQAKIIYERRKQSAEVDSEAQGGRGLRGQLEI